MWLYWAFEFLRAHFMFINNVEPLDYLPEVRYVSCRIQIENVQIPKKVRSRLSNRCTFLLFITKDKTDFNFSGCFISIHKNIFQITYFNFFVFGDKYEIMKNMYYIKILKLKIFLKKRGGGILCQVGERKKFSCKIKINK